MTNRRAIGLLAPITVGTALVGVSLLGQSESDESFRRWSEAERAELPAVARQAVEEQRAPRPLLAQLHIPPVNAGDPADAKGASAKSARRLSTRARTQLSASDRTLAGRLAEQAELFRPTTPILPPEYRQPSPSLTARPGALKPEALALPEPAFGLVKPTASLPDLALAEVASDIALVQAPATSPIQGLAAASAALPSGSGFALAASEVGLPRPSDGQPSTTLAIAPANPAEPEPFAAAQPLASDLPAQNPTVAASFADIVAPLAPTAEQAGGLISAPAVSAPIIAAPAETPNHSVPHLAEDVPAAQTVADFAPLLETTAQPGTSAAPDPQSVESAPLAADAEPAAGQLPPPQPSALAPVETPTPAPVVSASLSPQVLGALPFVSDVLVSQADTPPPLAAAEEGAALVSTAARQASPTSADESTALTAAQGQGIEFSSGRQVFPASADAPILSYDDELILQIRVAGVTATDTIIAYGTREGIYLPFGELSRILDLAIRISDDGNYASGWFLSENRTLTIDLRQQILTINGEEQPLPDGMAQAFDGDMFLRSEAFALLLPLEIEPDLRSQAITLTTLEPFPFEERMRRDVERARLNSRQARPEDASWPREETPWLAASVPIADIELRAVSDPAKGERLEGDLRLAGDLAFMTAQGFFSVTTRDGLVASLVELGRRDADGDLLGPLHATEFQLGDVATTPMPLGLRGTSGRGAYITNQRFESVSVFDQIDLRGVLPDGYEVELYRNDVLLDSTRETVNGQYEFLQIPVDYGLNIFRLVFYGPQGQRREEVRRISVGDGRLSSGQFQYSLGAVQRGVNLLGVEGPDFRPQNRYGNWQAVGEVSYGLSNAVTSVFSGAIFEEQDRQRWITSAGLRTGIGGLAVRGDVGLSDGGGHALGLGLGGRAMGGAFTLSHFEYGGDFLDEVRSIGTAALRRATEFDFNTSLNIGGAVDGTYLPVTARARHIEFQDGRTRTNANLRASARLPGMIVSNTLEYLRTTATGGIGFSQVIGNFDLATFNRSSTQVRGSLGYRVAPDPDITQVAAEVSHTVDDLTVVRGSTSYSFDSDDWTVGLSAIREFERFTVALDGQYGFGRDSYAVALRIGFSLGRDPLRRKVYMARPGQAVSGAAALRAFQDMDGDGHFGPGDAPLPDVDFAVFNNVATTDENGMARLGELGHGNRVAIQADPSTLPDILMAPVNRGVEIVPRAGRFHVTDYPIVALSEVEGTVSFAGNENQRGVSGLRLQLRDETGEVKNTVRTERGGYFFFEQVKPGTYDLVIDPGQAERLGICLDTADTITVGPVGDIISREFSVLSCGNADSGNLAAADPATAARPSSPD